MLSNQEASSASFWSTMDHIGVMPVAAAAFDARVAPDIAPLGQHAGVELARRLGGHRWSTRLV
jgi:hypothetical protein